MSPLARADTIAAMPEAALAEQAVPLAQALLEASESVLEDWLRGHGQVPGSGEIEGFRLLALHRQAARGTPSFNACRESCRELIFQCNMARVSDDTAARARRLRLAAMVARHLALFVAGKLENAGLGEFCCSARDLRGRDEGGVGGTMEVKHG